MGMLLLLSSVKKVFDIKHIHESVCCAHKKRCCVVRVRKRVTNHCVVVGV